MQQHHSHINRINCDCPRSSPGIQAPMPTGHLSYRHSSSNAPPNLVQLDSKPLPTGLDYPSKLLLTKFKIQIIYVSPGSAFLSPTVVIHNGIPSVHLSAKTLLSCFLKDSGDIANAEARKDFSIFIPCRHVNNFFYLGFFMRPAK